MNLPNYFLANLASESPLSPAMITEACRTLKRNRVQFLTVRSTQNIIELLCEVAQNWLKPDDKFRRLALENGPKETGFSKVVLAKGLDDFFRQFTTENFAALLAQEFGHPQRLEKFVANDEKSSRAAMVVAPEFQVHIGAGNIPNPTLTSMVFGLLLRSAQFVKCGRGAAFLPRLFAHSIYDTDPKIGACLEIADWRGGNLELESALFAEAECVTATGSDETLAVIRSRLPVHTRFLGYGQRVSFGFVTKEILAESSQRIVVQAADDIVAWNQLGCLSPHIIYVQEGGRILTEDFAELLAKELAQREIASPRGEVAIEESAAIASRRAFYEVRAAHSPDTRHWFSQGSTAWTVVYEADARFQMSCLNRFIYIKPVADVTAMLRAADVVRGKVSTVGLAAMEHQTPEIARQLAHWGVTRICPLGQMQNPPLTWRHDGRPALSDLVTWVDFEQNI